MTAPRPSDTSQPAAEAGRLERAMAFLQEAVYLSRQTQASSTGLAPASEGGGQCGLGEKAAVALELSPRGEELFAELWPDGLDDAAVGRLHAAMTAWIERQDALDRKRNHFMKDFRHRHGFDRNAYDATQLADWDAGLAAVNGEVNARLRESATALLEAAASA